MKTKTLGILFAAAVFVSSGIASWMDWTPPLITANQDRIQDRTQDQDRTRLQDQSCLSDGSCSQTPLQTQDRDRMRLQDQSGSSSGSWLQDRDRIQDQDRTRLQDQSCLSDGSCTQEQLQTRDQDRDRLRDQSCLSDASCLQDRDRIQDRIRLLQRQTSETETSLQSYVRANLSETERNMFNTRLRAFRNELNMLDNDFKRALRAGSDIQPIRDRIGALYSAHIGILLPYIDSTKVENFRSALQMIITNRMNLRQQEENRRMLSEQDESKIERFIEWVPPSQRLAYLNRVLSRIETLMQNIENSNMEPARKERNLALLDEILTLLQARIDDIIAG